MSKPIQIESLGGDRWRCMIAGSPVRFTGSREAAERFFRGYVQRADSRGVLRTEAGGVVVEHVTVYR